MTDDMGDGKYDYIPMCTRVPIHANKAVEFLRKDDEFNARQHALAVLHLCAEIGTIGTPPYRQAERVLRELGAEVPEVNLTLPRR